MQIEINKQLNHLFTQFLLDQYPLSTLSPYIIYWKPEKWDISRIIEQGFEIVKECQLNIFTLYCVYPLIRSNNSHIVVYFTEDFNTIYQKLQGKNS